MAWTRGSVMSRLFQSRFLSKIKYLGPISKGKQTESEQLGKMCCDWLSA